MPSEQEKKSYTKKIRTAKYINIMPTDKNNATRDRLGITYEDMKSLVRSVDENDYEQGPLKDINTLKGGFVWVFKKQEYSESFYIKTKLIEKKDTVNVLSCHIDNIEC